MVSVESLVCIGEMIGPSRSGAGRDARVRLHVSTLLFAAVFTFAPSLDGQRRIGREPVPTRAAPDCAVRPSVSMLSASQIGEPTLTKRLCWTLTFGGREKSAGIEGAKLL